MTEVKDESVINVETGASAFQWSKLLIVATILLPMVAAYWIYQTGMGIPKGTINKGDLLQPPVQITELTLQSAAGDAISFQTLEKKWRLVVPAFGSCDAACMDSLYVTRQVHTRLNEKYPRVERWLVTNIEDPAFLALLAKDYPHIGIHYASAQDWQRLVGATSNKHGNYFMMDQNGFLMMSYSQAHTGNDLLADLKRMLKFTREH